MICLTSGYCIAVTTLYHTIREITGEYPALFVEQGFQPAIQAEKSFFFFLLFLGRRGWGEEEEEQEEEKGELEEVVASHC